jgi:hypothetical protein
MSSWSLQRSNSPLDAADERVPFVLSDMKRRTAPAASLSVPGANLAAELVRYLNIVAIRETQRAFHPCRARDGSLAPHRGGKSLWHESRKRFGMRHVHATAPLEGR